MPLINNYFQRVPKETLQSNVYARSIKRKLYVFNYGESKCEKSQKTNSDETASPPSVELDENLPLDKTSVSIKEYNSLLCNQKNLERQIHDKVNFEFFGRLIYEY